MWLRSIVRGSDDSNAGVANGRGIHGVSSARVNAAVPVVHHLDKHVLETLGAFQKSRLAVLVPTISPSCGVSTKAAGKLPKAASRKANKESAKTHSKAAASTASNACTHVDSKAVAEATARAPAKTAPKQPSNKVAKAVARSKVKAASTVAQGTMSGLRPAAAGSRKNGEAADFCSSPRAERRCYEVLGIMRSATASEVRHAYRRKSLQVHPDKGGETIAFLSVAEAFETLSESGSRRAYDRDLALFGSSDGWGGTSGEGVTVARHENHDLATLVHILCEMSPAEWPLHVASLTSSSLKQMDDLIANPNQLASEIGTTQGDVHVAGGGHATTRLSCLQWDKHRRSWRVRLIMNGLQVCSGHTRSSSKASQWHISVVTLRELFRAYRNENANMPLEEAWTAAFTQARSRRIYFPAVHFSFNFRLEAKKDGVRLRANTPSVHCLDLAMEHRKQLLPALCLGLDKQKIDEVRSRLKEAVEVQRVEWQSHMRETQTLLQGFILCELYSRSRTRTSENKRRRLKWKQTVKPGYDSMPALSWLTELLIDETTNKENAQDCLRSFLNADGGTSLRQLLHDAMQMHPALPQVPN